MSRRNIERVAKGACEMYFNTGDTIIRECEPANRFHLIESGAVAVEAHERANGTFPIQTLTKGDTLGWSWLLSPFVWHFQARALKPTVMLVLDAGDLLVEAEEDHEFGCDLMIRVAQILVGRLRATRRQLIDSERSLFRDHAGECRTTSLERIPKAAAK